MNYRNNYNFWHQLVGNNGINQIILRLFSGRKSLPHNKFMFSMISKNKIKYIQSLHRKKIRDQESLFLVEGDKLVKEAFKSNFNVKTLCAKPDFIAENRLCIPKSVDLIEVTAVELKKISILQSPQRALALVEMPQLVSFQEKMLRGLSLVLDGIQDPGNLGTIIRSADWFGIENIYCSSDTVDCYNPKVIQATMGAIFRVHIHYLGLSELLQKAFDANVPSYGAFLEGNCIYDTNISDDAILVMGNEGNGIRPEIESHITERINIPTYALRGSESLNVGIATSICLAEFRRRTYR